MSEVEMKLNLVMPMAGGGTRFFNDGYEMPKPLIEIYGKPFFYWVTKSIAKFAEIETLTFVVLKEHCDRFNIDKEILKEVLLQNSYIGLSMKDSNTIMILVFLL